MKKRTEIVVWVWMGRIIVAGIYMVAWHLHLPASAPAEVQAPAPFWAGLLMLMLFLLAGVALLRRHEWAWWVVLFQSGINGALSLLGLHHAILGRLPSWSPLATWAPWMSGVSLAIYLVVVLALLDDCPPWGRQTEDREPR
ncbi:MAG TPA: hypothetical protein VGM19_08175 [Armatimonadota bacterium]|jgi:hypothetical protein